MTFTLDPGDSCVLDHSVDVPEVLLAALFCLGEQTSQIVADVYALCVHFWHKFSLMFPLYISFLLFFSFCIKSARRQYCEIEEE